jgi:hypothetical protein
MARVDAEDLDIVLAFNLDHASPEPRAITWRPDGHPDVAPSRPQVAPVAPRPKHAP